MTGVFAVFDAAGWIGQLPPRQIVDRVFPVRDESAAQIITMTSHFGYGALLGSAYSAASRSPSVVGGAVFGLSVCAVTYEGVLPLLRIRQPLHRDSAREIAALAVAHLAYGATLGRSVARRRRTRLIMDTTRYDQGVQ